MLRDLGTDAHDSYISYTSKKHPSVSMPACGREAKRDLEGIVDEPLKCRLKKVSQAKKVFGESINTKVPIIAILTGSPFHKPRKPMLPYILDMAFPALSPALPKSANVRQIEMSRKAYVACQHSIC